MIIPRFWGKAEAEVKTPRGKNVFLRKWHWSDISIADAQEKASEALQSTIARVRAGEPFPARYAYSTNQPLREEIVRAVVANTGEPAAIITRNAYGALVLNAERAMFVDVDLEPSSTPASSDSGLLGRLFGALFSKPAPAPTPPVAISSTADEAIARVEQWVRTQGGDWGFRVYQTASGLRLLAIHAAFDPEDESTLRGMQEIGCDPLYVKLCRSQKSFRARLTPKPWRIGMRAPAVRFPYEGQQVQGMQKWVARYEAASSSVATCRFLRTIGNQDIRRDIQPIVDVHDDVTRAMEPNLRLA